MSDLFSKTWTIMLGTWNKFVEADCFNSAAAIAYYTIFSLPAILAFTFLIASQFSSVDQVDRLMKDQLGIPAIGDGDDVEQKIAEANGDGNAARDASQTSAETSAASERGQSDSDNANAETEDDTPKASYQQLEENQDDNEKAKQSALIQLANRAQLAKDQPIWFKLFGAGLLVFSATSLFTQLQLALNRIWSVAPDKKQDGIIHLLLKRVLSFGMVLVIAFLLLVSLVITTLIDELMEFMSGYFDGQVFEVGIVVVNSVITWAMVTLLFAAVYKVFPDAKLRWRQVFLGAAVTSLLFVVGKTVIGWYIEFSDAGSTWGNAAASMIGVLVWVYYSSLLVLFGAAFTQAWSHEHRERTEPEEGAVKVRHQDIVEGAHESLC